MFLLFVNTILEISIVIIINHSTNHIHKSMPLLARTSSLGLIRYDLWGYTSTYSAGMISWDPLFLILRIDTPQFLGVSVVLAVCQHVFSFFWVLSILFPFFFWLTLFFIIPCWGGPSGVDQGTGSDCLQQSKFPR